MQQLFDFSFEDTQMTLMMVVMVVMMMMVVMVVVMMMMMMMGIVATDHLLHLW